MCNSSVSTGGLKLDPVEGTYVDLGIMLHLTSPDWAMFDPHTIEIFTPNQAVHIPQTALVFSDTSDTSFISPEFKVVAPFLGTATTGLLWWKFAAMGGALAGPFGLLASIAAGVSVELFFDYLGGQTVKKTYEEPGTSTYRKLRMDPFQAGEPDQALFARLVPDYRFHCGSIKIVIRGTLYSMFWHESGSYALGFPVDVEIVFVLPMFVRV